MPEYCPLIKKQDDALLPQADRDFEAAVRALDFLGIQKSLAYGANPNRPFTDCHDEDFGYRAMRFLGANFSNSYSLTSFGKSHALAMKALVEAGADFSLPTFLSRESRAHPFAPHAATGSPSLFHEHARNLWNSPSLSIESCVWFAKGGGSMSDLFGGPASSKSFACNPSGAAFKRQGLAEDVLGPFWDLAIKPVLGADGSSILLSNALGQGLLEWSEWLIAKGATPAPTSLSGGIANILALDTIFRGNPERTGHCPRGVENDEFLLATQRMEREAKACARRAVALGEDVDAATHNAPPAILGLLAQCLKDDVDASLDFASTLLQLGANPFAGHGGLPFLAYALSDPENIIKQLDFALSAGADPKDRSRQAVLSMLKPASPEHDKAACQAIHALAALGADFSQPASEPVASSLMAVAASNGLWESAKALAGLGCDPRWKEASSGNTLISLAARWSAVHGRSSHAKILATWLSAAGAPMDEPGDDGFTALHHAAKALDFNLCEALLCAGADVNRLVADAKAMTPVHLASIRFNKKKEPAQMATMETLARHGADFSKVDGRGRPAIEIASKNSALSVLMALAQNAKGKAFVGKAGARASKALAARGEAFLSVAERCELDSAFTPPANSSSKRPRRSL